MKTLKIIGACFIGIMLFAIVSAPDKAETPQKEITRDEMRQSITRSLCRETVMDSLKTKDGATIALTRNHPQAVDEGGVLWAYVDTVRAQNSFGVMLEDLFECRVSFAMGEPLPVYLKIGHNVLVGE